ncbi:UvrB/UvrC motif-containing protein [Paenibacillus sp. sgz500958]|uniref:UvrB/UvrC motif-containing protein n=1 Tax=Paenibacillus sp. sgz500958 TaxID=3242475 RepID=UPI0036D21F06
MNLTEKVKNLPLSPGVYLMKDSLGHIIYVGKAKQLKKRVQSYFYNSKGHSPKVKQLVAHIRDLEYRLTDTEFEAFMLECQLIHEIKPMYNRKMKNPLNYTYIAIRTNHAYSRIEVTSDMDVQEGTLLFGPYTSRSTVERAVRGLEESMKILCSGSSGKHSLCWNHSLGLCIGVCAGGEALIQYTNIRSRIIALLDGSDSGVLDEMEQRMLQAAENFDFEAAAKMRDYIGAVRFLQQKEKVTRFAGENRRFAVLEGMDDNLLKLLLIQGCRLVGQQRIETENLGNDALRSILCSFIREVFGTLPLQTSLEISRHEIDEAQIIYSYLKSSSCSHLEVPAEWTRPEPEDGLEEAVEQLLAASTDFLP